jgi:hypothetical protein
MRPSSGRKRRVSSTSAAVSGGSLRTSRRLCAKSTEMSPATLSRSMRSRCAVSSALMSRRTRLSRRKVLRRPRNGSPSTTAILSASERPTSLAKKRSSSASRPAASGGGSTRTPKSCAARSGVMPASGRSTARQRLWKGMESSAAAGTGAPPSPSFSTVKRRCWGRPATVSRYSSERLLYPIDRVISPMSFAPSYQARTSSEWTIFTVSPASGGLCTPPAGRRAGAACPSRDRARRGWGRGRSASSRS